MLFTCKKFMFSDFKWKKIHSRKWWEGPAPFLYGTDSTAKFQENIYFQPSTTFSIILTSRFEINFSCLSFVRWQNEFF